jgi:hypothetical protein
MERISLTPEQKLLALSLKYYSHLEWKIKPGDYYTSARNDLELYQIVDTTEYEVITRRCNELNEVINWTVWTKIDFFTNFHDYRVFVPEFIFNEKQN